MASVAVAVPGILVQAIFKIRKFCERHNELNFNISQWTALQNTQPRIAAKLNLSENLFAKGTDSVFIFYIDEENHPVRF